MTFSFSVIFLFPSGNFSNLDCYKASLESIRKQIGEGVLQINQAKESSSSAKSFGLIIDGKSLEFSLKKDVEKSFFELAINCASVICCRSTPKQKALVCISLMSMSIQIIQVFSYGHLLASNNLIELLNMCRLRDW